MIGQLLSAGIELGTEFFKGKTEQTKAKAKKNKEVAEAQARQMVTKITEEGESIRKAIAAESGTKRALIAKNMRLMRRVTLAVLLMPLVVGAFIIAATYVQAWWAGTAPQPDFTPLSLFWSEVVDGTPDWWVKALQGVFAFLWAGGEVTNVSAQAGGAVLDHLKAGRESKERQAKEARKAEREKRNREREGRGEPALPDNPDEEDPIVPRGPPGGGP